MDNHNYKNIAIWKHQFIINSWSRKINHFNNNKKEISRITCRNHNIFNNFLFVFKIARGVDQLVFFKSSIASDTYVISIESMLCQRKSNQLEIITRIQHIYTNTLAHPQTHRWLCALFAYINTYENDDYDNVFVNQFCIRNWMNESKVSTFLVQMMILTFNHLYVWSLSAGPLEAHLHNHHRQTIWQLKRAGAVYRAMLFSEWNSNILELLRFCTGTKLSSV